MENQIINPELHKMISEIVEAKLQSEIPKMIEAYFEKLQNNTATLSIIASKGTMDMAYPPFILASMAAAMGWKVKIFFTFYGINLLKKDLSGLSMSALGNPAMPMHLPLGPEWIQKIDLNIPNFIQSSLPGFEQVMTAMMKKQTKNKGVASIEELRTECLENGVELIACQMALDLFNIPQVDLLSTVRVAGAATFLNDSKNSSISLFI